MKILLAFFDWFANHGHTVRNLVRAFRRRTAMATVLSCLTMMWSSALAATLAVTRDAMLTIDPLLAILTCVLSTLTGATTLFIRMNNILMGDEIGPDGLPKPIAHPWVFAGAHMLGSWTAGAVGFVLGKANDWGPWTVLLAVIMMSFLGAKGVEKLADKWLSSVKFGPGNN